MAQLIYAANVSLDGYTEDREGRFDWAPPDDDVFGAITEVMRTAGTYLYGRRMYETMAVWETDPTLATHSELTATYADVWQGADKLVFSSTLAAATTERTRVEPRFDPDVVADLKRTASSDLIVGGPTLAAHAFAAGLVDVCELFVWPVMLAGTKPALPGGGRIELALADVQPFANGVVRLRYDVR